MWRKGSNISPDFKYLVLIIPVFFLAGIAFTGCHPNQKPPESALNVILILLDTVRVDKLGCYNSNAMLTPEIDRFAENSVVFKNAFSHAPWTLPSVASIFTSQYPEIHGAGGRLGQFHKLSGNATTLADVFKTNGWTTGTITNVPFLGPEFGMDRGFQSVDSFTPKNDLAIRDAKATTAATEEWLSRHTESRFFLFVHYFDAHLIYNPPPKYREKFAAPEDKHTTDYIFGSIDDMKMFRKGLIHLDTGTISRLESLYNGEIAYLDNNIRHLLNYLKSTNLWTNSIIILTSDHGEEFNDHGNFEHGHTVFDELLHIPLIVHFPEQFLRKSGIRSAQTIQSTVRHVDIGPTLCDAVGIQIPGSFMGKSFLPLLTRKQASHRPVFSQGNMWGPEKFSWRKHPFKLIYAPKAKPVFQLYDIVSDPREKNNLAETDVSTRREMESDLLALISYYDTKKTIGESPSLDRAETERLRSLGYITGE